LEPLTQIHRSAPFLHRNIAHGYRKIFGVPTHGAAAVVLGSAGDRSFLASGLRSRLRAGHVFLWAAGGSPRLVSGFRSRLRAGHGSLGSAGSRLPGAASLVMADYGRTSVRIAAAAGTWIIHNYSFWVIYF